MKKIGSFNLGLAFAGCFLGAGYVSGQELWQFFGSFGAKGVAGLLLAVALLFFTGIIMILLGRLTRLSEIDKIVVRRDWPLLRGAVTVLELLFLFGVGTIMSAGVGALLEQLFGLAPFIGSAVFAALVAVVSLAGFSGMVSAFSATVPVLSVVTLIFGIMSICSNGLVLPQSGGGSNPLMSSWLVAALRLCRYTWKSCPAVHKADKAYRFRHEKSKELPISIPARDPITTKIIRITITNDSIKFRIKPLFASSAILSSG